MDSFGGTCADCPGVLCHITRLKVWGPHSGIIQTESSTDQASQDGETENRDVGERGKGRSREPHSIGEDDRTEFGESLITPVARPGYALRS